MRSSSRARRASSASVIAVSEVHVADVGHRAYVLPADPGRRRRVVGRRTRPVDPVAPVEPGPLLLVVGIVRQRRGPVLLVEALHLGLDPPVLLRRPLAVTRVV